MHACDKFIHGIVVEYFYNIRIEQNVMSKYLDPKRINSLLWKVRESSYVKNVRYWLGFDGLTWFWVFNVSFGYKNKKMIILILRYFKERLTK